MKTFLGLVVMLSGNKQYKKHSERSRGCVKMAPSWQIVVKWRHLVESVIMASAGGYFSHVHKQLARFQIVIFSKRFVARLAFSNVMPCLWMRRERIHTL